MFVSVIYTKIFFLINEDSTEPNDEQRRQYRDKKEEARKTCGEMRRNVRVCSPHFRPPEASYSGVTSVRTCRLATKAFKIFCPIQSSRKTCFEEAGSFHSLSAIFYCYSWTARGSVHSQHTSCIRKKQLVATAPSLLTPHIAGYTASTL